THTHIFQEGCLCHVLSMVVSLDAEVTRTMCGGDCQLRCAARSKPGVQYRAVRWYKVGEPPSSQLSGLLVHNLLEGSTRLYVGVQRQVELLGDSYTIFMPNVTSADSGKYVCHLSAPVGERNQEGEVHLTVTGCPDSPSVDLMKDCYLVIFATVLLMAALLIFIISYRSLKSMLKETSSSPKKEIFLDAPLKPLEKKELEMIWTLGPDWSKQPTIKHVFV
uniref:Ig-like domain-containing protein n=1 Tax=Myripristis murdjan TaxID=586833 RepID=A0A667XZ14_9TELE